MTAFRKPDGFGGGNRSGGFRQGGGRPSFPRKGGFGGSRGRDDSRPMQMHSATCAQCGKVAEVPFRPTGERPIYCRDCFGDKRESPRSDSRADFGARREAPRNFAERTERPAEPQRTPQNDQRIADLMRQTGKLSDKLDVLASLIEKLVTEKSEVPKHSAPATPAKKPIKKVAKKVVAKKVATKKK